MYDIKKIPMYQKAFKILKASIGIRTTKKELLPPFPFSHHQVHSLLTDFKEIKEIKYSESLDGVIEVRDRPQYPHFVFQRKKVLLNGPFLKFNKKAVDMRFSLWGNQGIFFHYVLYLLEKYHSIYNFHACGLFDRIKNVLYIIMGGSGSGKTVFLLEGIHKGLKVFSTETLHCQIKKGNIKFYMGPLVDNVRYGNLIHHFPQFLPSKETPPHADVWKEKVAINLSSYKSVHEKLINPPKVLILFPRVEEGRKHTHLNPYKNKDQCVLSLFRNLSQKISETFLLYNQLPIPGFDNEEMAAKRLQFIQTLLEHPSLTQVTSVLSAPTKCWEKFLK